MFETIDVQDYYGADLDEKHCNYAAYQRIQTLADKLFKDTSFSYKFENPSGYQDGSAFTDIKYIIDSIPYRIIFSKFGKLFTICSDEALSEINYDFVNEEIWESPFTSKAVSFFTGNGFLYIDFSYAKHNYYDGRHENLKGYTILARYFGLHVSDKG